MELTEGMVIGSANPEHPIWVEVKDGRIFVKIFEGSEKPAAACSQKGYEAAVGMEIRVHGIDIPAGGKRVMRRGDVVKLEKNRRHHERFIAVVLPRETAFREGGQNKTDKRLHRAPVTRPSFR